MSLTENRQRIVEALQDGPLNPDELANRTEIALFIIRAELKLLRRDQLVTESLRIEDGTWELTAGGHRYVNAVCEGRR
jgi:predicted transcriptional regulator